MRKKPVILEDAEQAQVHPAHTTLPPLRVPAIQGVLPVNKIKPYIGLYDTVPCYKNGKIDLFGNTVELTVNLTNKCNSCCTFCSNSFYPDYDFDFEKFKVVFETLRANYYIAKVGITGGEPTMHKDFYRLITYVRERLTNTEIVVNSNGSNLEALEYAGSLNAEIGLSRHHYLDEENFDVFGTTEVPTAKQISNFQHKKNILMHCNLIRGKIDSQNECLKFLNWCESIGIEQVGFVELIPYTKQAELDRVQVDILQFPNSIITRLAERHGICRCANILYDNKVKVYTRQMEATATQCKELPNSPFVYNMNRLMHGFSGQIIWDMNERILKDE